MNIDRKYVLCRPEGGLNDILCRIWTCFQYSLISGRILPIDSASTGFKEPFSQYFLPKYKNTLCVRGEDLPNLLGINFDFFPAIPDSINGYVARYEDGRNYFCERSGQALQFDLAKQYQHRLLLYHACGGGSFGIEGLKLFTLAPEIRSKIQHAIDLLPSNYDSIHIRATDLKVNYEQFLNDINRSLKSDDIYLATDSKSALDLAKTALIGRRVHNFSHSLAASDKPLHMWDPNNPASWNRSQINEDAIKDLFLLAKANNIYFPTTKNGGVSGFSVLALRLKESSEFLDELLSNES